MESIYLEKLKELFILTAAQAKGAEAAYKNELMDIIWRVLSGMNIYKNDYVQFSKDNFVSDFAYRSYYIDLDKDGDSRVTFRGSRILKSGEPSKHDDYVYECSISEVRKCLRKLPKPVKKSRSKKS